MQLKRISYAFLSILKETFRNRIIFLLLLLIPTIFYLIAIWTTPDNYILIKIASARDEPLIKVMQIELGLIYIGLAVTGFIVSYIALVIMQRNFPASKRLVLCGYKTRELSVSKFILIIIIVIVIGVYTALLGMIYITPKHVPGVIAGYVLSGFVYGSFGLLIGAILKRELEGILIIVLLANLDLGWLQNPIFYAASQNKFIIRFLPGFNPAQVCVVSAFTDFSILHSIIYSLIYGTVFLILSMIIFRFRMRTMSYTFS
jgi:ABC-2 type transport system permease protein